MKKLIIFFVILITIVVLTLLYSRFIGIRNIQIREYKIVNKNFTDNYYGFKIVHITDIQYGKVTFDKELEELVKKVNLTKPDIIVFTGDLINKNTKLTSEQADKIASTLSKMKANIGKYAVQGDYDTNFRNWSLIMENSGFKILNNTKDTIYLESERYILISGVDSNNTSINQRLKETEEYLKDKKDNEPIYSILLMHKPDDIQDINTKNYNLVLAGHSLNGQVRFPIIGAIGSKPDGAKKYYNSYYKVKDSDLYISGGIGTATSNFRLNNRPSFNLYRIVNK